MGPVRLRNSAHWGSVNGTQKGKTQGNDSASCLWFGLSVRRSRLGASRRSGGGLRCACIPTPDQLKAALKYRFSSTQGTECLSSGQSHAK